MIRLRIVIGFIISTFLLSGSDAQAQDKADPLKAVVELQLEAFRKNDFAGAYGFAHSGVQQQFPQAEFEKMVRGGFGAMLKPGVTGFGKSLVNGEVGTVEVTLAGEDGEVSAYKYFLEKEKGAWRITAVLPIEVKPEETLVLAAAFFY